MGKKEKKSEELKEIIIKILKKYNVKKAGIFGSCVREEQNTKSDIYILIETPANFSLLDFVGLKLEIEKSVKRKVDLVDYRVIKERIKQRRLNEEVKII